MFIYCGSTESVLQLFRNSWREDSLTALSQVFRNSCAPFFRNTISQLFEQGSAKRFATNMLSNMLSNTSPSLPSPFNRKHHKNEYCHVNHHKELYIHNRKTVFH